MHFLSIDVRSLQCVAEPSFVWTDEDERVLAEEAVRLQAETNSVRAETNNLDLRIREMSCNLQTKNKDVFDVYQALLLEVSALNAKHAAAQTKLADPEPESEEETPEDRTKALADRINKLGAPSRKERREIETLYKKIALKTHPDKTKDTELHAIFFMAKEALKNSELDLLIEIWDGLKNGRKKFSKLRVLIKSIRQQWQDALRNRSCIKASVDFQLLQAYEVPTSRPQAEMFHRQSLQKMVQNTKNEIHRLDPSRYPPMPVWPAASFTTTTYYR